MTKYTFLLPAYKSKYLKESLESIIQQSYQNFNVLISDDCSPEDLNEIVNQFSDPRIQYHRNSQNIGAERLVNHWNQLLEKTEAEYIIMASDDDIYEIDFLKEIDNLTQKYPQVNLLRARIRQINENGEPIYEDKLYPEFQNELEATLSCPDLCVANYVFKRTALVQAGGFMNFPYAMGSDTATALMMSDNGLATTSDILFNYRISNTQISHASKNKIMDRGKMKAALQFHTWLYTHIKNLNYDKTLLNQLKVKSYIKERILNGIKHCARFYYGALDLKDFISLYKTMNSIGCFNRKYERLIFILDYLNNKKLYKS